MTVPHTPEVRAAIHSSEQHPVYKVEVLHPDGRLLGTALATNATTNETRAGGTINRTLQLNIVNDPNLVEVINGALRQYGQDGDTYGGMGGYFGTYAITDVLGDFQPYGAEVRVSTGYELRSVVGIGRAARLTKRVEWFEMCRMPITKVQYSDSDADAGVVVGTDDRSILISSNSWDYPITLGSGTYLQHLRSIIANRTPEYWSGRLRVTSNVTETTAAPLTQYGAQTGGDPWSDVVNLARLVGCIVHVNRSGQIQIDRAPEYRTAPDQELPGATYELSDGDGGLVVSVERTFDRKQSFNRVQVIGENVERERFLDKDRPAYGVSSDSFAYSGMRTQGPVGVITKTVRSNRINEDAVATNYANYLAASYIGLFESVTVTMVPDPTLTLLDVVHLTYPELAIDARYWIEKISCNWSDEGGLMTVNLVRRRSIEDDRSLQQQVGVIPEA